MDAYERSQLADALKADSVSREPWNSCGIIVRGLSPPPFGVSFLQMLHIPPIVWVSESYCTFCVFSVALLDVGHVSGGDV